MFILLRELGEDIIPFRCVQDHIADGGCDFESVECPFSETGCHHKVPT